MHTSHTNLQWLVCSSQDKEVFFFCSAGSCPWTCKCWGQRREGAVGLAENPGAPKRWMVVGPELAWMVGEFQGNSIGTFSIKFFKENCKPQTAKCHVTTALRSRLQFTFEPQEGIPAVSDLWQGFLPQKNCTASHLKVWTSFLYLFAMCVLDFWSRINELLLIFGRLKWYTSTWWKQQTALNNERIVRINFIFLSAVLTKESILFQSSVTFFCLSSILLLNSYNLTQSQSLFSSYF